MKRPAQYLFTNYNQSVYTLLWCEQLIPDQYSVEQNGQKKSNHFDLYSVADGKIMQHCVQSFSFGKESSSSAIVASKNFYQDLKKHLEGENETPGSSLEYGLTEFSVLKIEANSVEKKNDYFFAIGKFDGSMEIYRTFTNDKRIEKICTFFNHQKLVTCIKWNLTTYPNESNDHEIYIASGSNDFNIILIDFKSLISESQHKVQNQNFYSKYKHKLVGHKERITSLSWAKSSNVNLLASCSYDSTVQVNFLLNNCSLIFNF